MRVSDAAEHAHPHAHPPEKAWCLGYLAGAVCSSGTRSSPGFALESSDGSLYASLHGVGGPGAVAVPPIALQREGALGARLEAHPPRTAVAPAGPPRAARDVDDTPKVRARPRARRAGDRRL